MAEIFIPEYKAEAMRTNENNSMPFMKSLTNCLNKMVQEGYSENFTITDKGLASIQYHNYYQPDQIAVVNFFRFEGESDPDDNAILYVIETNDGVRGTLVDAYGVYTDSKLSQFMKNVETIQKKDTNNKA